MLRVSVLVVEGVAVGKGGGIEDTVRYVQGIIKRQINGAL